MSTKNRNKEIIEAMLTLLMAEGISKAEAIEIIRNIIKTIITTGGNDGKGHK